MRTIPSSQYFVPRSVCNNREDIFSPEELPEVPPHSSLNSRLLHGPAQPDSVQGSIELWQGRDRGGANRPKGSREATSPPCPHSLPFTGTLAPGWARHLHGKSLVYRPTTRVADMGLMLGLNNMDFLSPRLTWLQLLLNATSVNIRVGTEPQIWHYF